MTVTKRPTTQEEKEVFEYLNDLRESGTTNMFGASPYVQEMFGLDREESKRLTLLWMKNFDREGNYDEVSD